MGNQKKKLSVVFMGTPRFAVPVLSALIEHHNVVAVYSQPPSNAGRGHKLCNSAVHDVALKHEIAVHTPNSLKDATVLEVFQAHQSDIAVVAAYGLIVPQAFLEAPKYGCINVHPSDLPKCRGASPIQRTVMSGDVESALCIMQMDAGLDTGDILHRIPVALESNITSGTLHDRMSNLAADAILEVLGNMDNLRPQKQANVGVSYASKISKDEALIDWNLPAARVDCIIRALNPFPVAYMMHNGERIKIYGCEIIDATGVPGTIIDDKLTIACAIGAIRPTFVQRPGGKVVSCADYLHGTQNQKPRS